MMDRRVAEQFQARVAREVFRRYKEVADRYEVRDFSLRKGREEVEAAFDDSLGYLPRWGYEPRVGFDWAADAWRVRLGGAEFLSADCPFGELVAELRGYTLVGPLPRDARVLDAGAYTGVCGSYWAARCRAGRVVFLEPDPASAKVLHEQIARNGFSNCAVVEKALAGETGRASFVTLPGGDSRLHEQGGLAVDTVTLSDLAAEAGDFDFIKLDIEGAEVEVADQLADYLLARPGAHAAVASYHETSLGPAYSILEKYFADRGLWARTLFPYHETTFVCHAENVGVVEALAAYPGREKGWEIMAARGRGEGKKKEKRKSW